MDLVPGGGPLTAADAADLRLAAALLAERSLAVRVAGLLGWQVNRGLDFVVARLPGEARTSVRRIANMTARRSLEQGYATVLAAVNHAGGTPNALRRLARRRGFDRAASAVSGLLGGAGGLPGTAVELPVTTGLLLRAVVQIAADEGEDVASDECRLECLKVMALGATDEAGDEESYWTVRIALSQALGGLGGRSVAELVPRVIAQVLPRFGVNVAWKFAGQAVPVAGAASGALLNLAFMRHYQGRARGHFIVRRLERVYGTPAVRAAWPDDAAPPMDEGVSASFASVA